MMLWIILFLTLLNFSSTKNVRNSDRFERQSENTWYKDAVSALKRRMRVKEINARAKNVILFIGDGMGPTTVTAARILDGQNKGQTGEENVLSWEMFDHVALSKTYNTDAQVPDSAGTATAFMSGIKTRAGVINVNEKAVRGDCASSLGQEILSLTMLAEEAGLSTGVVTTTRLTHATPSTGYAQAAERNWEHQTPDPRCKDIASQLIDFKHGDGLEVAFGGGRREFYPKTMKDPVLEEYGRRTDKRNLPGEWTNKTTEDNKYEYVYNAKGLRSLNPKNVDHVLGLFNHDHMSYSYNRKNATDEPTLPEMTEFAIAVLNRNPKGYFLLVEGGRIDHGHHGNKAFHAITDAVELNQAVHQATMLTKRHETLTIVTADHSHGFVVSGYQPRGNPIFGLTASSSDDNKVYTTLGYYNGPGGLMPGESRDNITQTQLADVDRRWQSLVPRGSASHGGEDVGIYAQGPQAHLINGVVEQNYIHHVISYALCLTKDKEVMCREEGLIGKENAAIQPRISHFVLFCSLFFIVKL